MSDAESAAYSPDADDMLTRIKALYDAVPPRPSEIKLTREQLDRIPKAEPATPWTGTPIGAFLGVPIRIVDTYWESTPGEQERAKLAKAIEEDMAGRDWPTFALDTWGPYEWDGRRP